MVGGWWFYIVVAIAPIAAIIQHYIIIGSIKMSTSSTFKASFNVF